MTDDKPKKLPRDFDTTAELWDRIADDVAARGTPCFDTVEKLLKDASEAEAQGAPGPEPSKDKE